MKKSEMQAVEVVVEVEAKRGPGRPKGKKVDWSLVSGRDWAYKTDREIAQIAQTSSTNVYLKRRALNKIGAAKYRGKKIKLGRPVKAVTK